MRSGGLAVEGVGAPVNAAAPAGPGGGSAGAAIATSNACIKGGAVDEVSSSAEFSAGFVFAAVPFSGSAAAAVEALIAAPMLGVSEFSSCERKSSSAADSFASSDCGVPSGAVAFEGTCCASAPELACVGFEREEFAAAEGRTLLEALEVAASALPSHEDLPCPPVDADDVDEGCGAGLRAAEPASSEKAADAGVAVAPAALFAAVWLAGPAGAGFTLSAGIDAPGWAAL